jgi:hypothetical protein
MQVLYGSRMSGVFRFGVRKKLAELLKAAGKARLAIMATNQILEQGPGEIEMLLPWHAVGTLNARDRRRVEEALAREPALAKQYAVVREEYAETIDLNESLGAPSARPMQKLFMAIDAEPVRVGIAQYLGADFRIFHNAVTARAALAGEPGGAAEKAFGLAGNFPAPGLDEPEAET